MGKIILDKEDTELNNILKEAYNMLTDIGVQVAPLSSIVIRYDKNTRKKFTANCIKKDNTFYITVHYKAKTEPEKANKKSHTFRAIMHELVHTIYNSETDEYGLFVHDSRFVGCAYEIKKEYDINIMTTIKAADFPYTNRPCLHSITCENCGATLEFYSEATWKKYQAYIAGKNLHCAYCKAILS